MPKVNSYGEEAAKRRAKKKLEREAALASSETKTLRQKSTADRIPQIEWFPLSNAKIEPFDFKINWDDESTESHSDFLLKQYLKMPIFQGSGNDSLSEYLKMPTGTGKTAIAVATIGKLQSALGKKLKVIITAPRAAIEGQGFAKTLLDWNQSFPDNTIEPVIITTIDKFATILKDRRTYVKVVKELGIDGFIIQDEAHKYKSPTSKRTKQMMKLQHVPKLQISATPIGNDVIFDSVSYLMQAGFYRNKTDFMNVSGLRDWVNMRGQLMVYDASGKVSRTKWPYYDTLLEQWSYMLYSPTIDIKSLNMPNVDTQLIQLTRNDDLTADLRSLYAAYTKRMFDSFTDYWMEYVERLCTDDQRYNALLEILQDPNTKQPIIFYWNDIVRETLTKRLKEDGFEPRVVAAGYSFADVDQSSMEPILMQYISGAEAVELKNSNTTIFYQNQTSYIALFQARGRNVRRGMSHQVTHYHLIADEPIDLQVFTTAFNRQMVSDEMLNEVSQIAEDRLMNDEELEEIVDEAMKDNSR